MITERDFTLGVEVELQEPYNGTGTVVAVGRGQVSVSRSEDMDDELYELKHVKPILTHLDDLTPVQLKQLEIIAFALDEPHGMHEAIVCMHTVISWLNANHIDYIGLIEAGAAIRRPSITQTEHSNDIA